tara:strand:- start:1427 stop:1993 length:567 start_codon:yes stop_codon:yes gene_type:complete
VVQWALEFEPGATVRAEFVDFLEQFVDFIEEFSAGDAKAVKRKLKRVQEELARQEVAGRPEAANDAVGEGKSTTGKSKSRTPAHIITYFFDGDTMNEEGGTQIGEKFTDWLSSFSKHAVGSSIYAVENTTLISCDNTAPVSKDSAMTGYTLVEIDDMDTVLSLAGNCPLLEAGGVLEVSRTVNLRDVW